MNRWDLWVDFHRTDSEGLTHAHVDDLTASAAVHAGQYLVVGDEGADPAVAQIVSVEPDGVLVLRVLPGPAETHRELLTSGHAFRGVVVDG